jgi:MFS family permease
MNYRNLSVLALSTLLSISGASIVALTAGIIGAELAPALTWATLPAALMVVGLALMTIPAAMIMKRIGRRKGFILSAVLAGLSALLAAYAISLGSFALFCLAVLLIGTNSAFTQQYRFAAAESVETRFAGRAVSFLLLSGVVAGFIGPEIAKRTKDLLPVAYSGSFVALAVLYALVIAILVFMRDAEPHPTGTETLAQQEERSLSKIVVQRNYLAAVLAGTVAYGVMSFIMTATPVHMHNQAGFPLGATALVIESHIIAMFLPSLFTGFLLERLGELRVMLIGIAAMLGTVLLGLVSSALLEYWAALVLLGVGWNFLFVGATVKLTGTYRQSERFKAQGFNDFSIFSVQALLSLSAGVVLFRTDWGTLNLLMLPLLALVFTAVVLTRRGKVREDLGIAD